MSLWHKPVSEITFADIDEFCRTMQAEGARLDYKGIAFPKDLAKTIAAFANTMGGLIILGIDADKSTNQPIWPPKQGYPTEAGLSERVVQVAQDGIYPPVRVAVSNVIQNDYLAGTVLLVIRIHESREAPHAIEKNRKVYVYERTDNKNEPYELADMQRIEQLLRRRNVLADAREAELQKNLYRAERHMHPSACPIKWMSISPVYPWREICEPAACRPFHELTPFAHRLCDHAHWRFQNCVGGSFGTGRVHQTGTAPVCVAVSSLSSNGTMFGIGYGLEAIHSNTTLLTTNEDLSKGNLWMNHRNIHDMAKSFMESCKQFYSQSNNPPGEVLVSIGVRNANQLYMQDTYKGKKSNAPFIDPEFRIDEILDCQDILASRTEALDSALNDIVFAFNAHAITQ